MHAREIHKMNLFDVNFNKTMKKMRMLTIMTLHL